MEYRFVFVVAILFFCGVGCENVEKVESTSTERAENASKATATDFSTRKGRSSNMVYAELVSCAVRYDTACLVGAAEDFLEIKRHELLAQADAQVSRASGRSDPENSPSHLAATVEKLLSELSGLFKNGFSSLFSAREAEDDDEIADADDNSVDDEDEDKEKDSRDVGEERGKKKKKKRKQKLKFLLVIGAIVAKISFLAQLLQTALLFKLALLGIGLLGVSVAKLIILVKHGKQKTIYYENSHHDHHYEHEEDDWQHDDHHGFTLLVAILYFVSLIYIGSNVDVNKTLGYVKCESKQCDFTRKLLLSNTNSSRAKGEKKKHKIGRLIQKILFMVTVISTLAFIFKIYYAVLAKKYFLLSIGYFIIHAIKSWFWFKYQKHGGHVYVEHDHFDDIHDHHDHYDHHGEHFDHHGDHTGYSASNGDYGDYGNQYHEHLNLENGHQQQYWRKKGRAQDIVYAKQKPSSRIR